MKVLAITLGIAAILSAIDAQIVGYGMPPMGVVPMVYPPVGYQNMGCPPVAYPIRPPVVQPSIGLNTAENSNANANTNVNNNGGGLPGRWF